MHHIVLVTPHWQGTRHYPLAIAPDGRTAEHVADLLSTCSFCAPGRTGHHDVGECYHARTMMVLPNVPKLPVDAARWSREDAQAWLETL